MKVITQIPLPLRPKLRPERVKPENQRELVRLLAELLLSANKPNDTKGEGD